MATASVHWGQMDTEGMKSPWKFLVPGVLGCIVAMIALVVVTAMSTQSGYRVALHGDAPPVRMFSIGIPTWYESTVASGVTTREVHWLNLLLFLGGLYVVCIPLGRLLADLSRPLRAGRIMLLVIGVVALSSVVAGMGISRYYWGYWYARPALDWRVQKASALVMLTPIHNLDPEPQPASQPFTNGGLDPGYIARFYARTGPDWSDTSRLSGSRETDGYYTLHGRVLNALEAAGHDLGAAPRRSDDQLADLWALAESSSVLDPGSGTYTRSAKQLTGYAVDLTGRNGDPSRSRSS